ncbi:SDR family NAD(P)-dependent oxidoreductase [Nocardia sp. CA-145437]|uniref:SDR family NAD(P)-dependent oxidoreductase n=1 Tax=Nocardia sp. CA-145437 TaxID=3239980 RepID=UPI003D97C09C
MKPHANKEPKVVVVTGASAGIGRAAARRFGAQGASVALLARGQAGLDAAAADVRDAGGRALAIPVDVADHAAVGTLVAQRLAPTVLDRYLARTGFDSQQTDTPAADRADNLCAPLDRAGGHDYGAHGEFDERAHPRSAQTWLMRKVLSIGRSGGV